MVAKLALADYLKASTWPLHSEAESTGVVADILHQRVRLADYLNFAQNLSEVYSALERETDWLRQYPKLQEYVSPMIYRRSQLEHDKVQLLASNSFISLKPIYAVTLDYCEHIRQAQNNSPAAMLAHIYVRYLGDLNGGQVLERLVKSALGVPDDCLTFYDFQKIENLKQFTLEFREALNVILLTEAERMAAAQSAMAAFRFNIALSGACQSQDSLD